MTADIYSYTFKYFYSGLPVRFRKASGFLPGRRLLSYLLTGLLTDLLTEGTFTADAAAYELLTALAYRGPHIVESDPGPPRQESISFIKKSNKEMVCF